MMRLMFCALALCFSIQANASTNLVKNGKSGYTIVLCASASPSEKHASEELQSFLRQMSGANLAIVSDNDPKPSKMILLGDSARLRELNVAIDYKDLGDEGFVIKTVGPHLVISGGKQRGTMYGTYAFLEEVLGCRWYSPNCTYIPKKKTIKFDKLDITQKPDFEHRDVSTSGRMDPDWCVRNRINGNDSSVTEKQGGKVSYYWFVHSFRALVPEDKYFKDHPEYFSLVEGRRQGGLLYQLCLSNPDVLKVSTAQVMEWCENNPTATIISVSQNDNERKCECDACEAEYDGYGSPSGQMLRFVNAIADEVAKKYPDKIIDTLAYQYTEKPPKGIKTRPNVCIRLAPIEACQYHVFGTCEKNEATAENLRAWNQICDRIYIWHYVTNFRNYVQPYPDLEQLIGTIPLYKNNGVKGMFAQGVPSPADQCGGAAWMSDLKQYLLAKMMWDADADGHKIMDDFLHGFFGKAAEPMKESIKLYQDTVLKDNIHGFFDDPSNAGFLTKEVMVEQEYWFDQAERLAESEEIRQRVKHARLSVDYVYMMYRVAQAKQSPLGDERKAVVDIINAHAADCARHGIVYWAEAYTMGNYSRDLINQLLVVSGFAKTPPEQAHYLDGGLYDEALAKCNTALDLPVDGWAFKGDNENIGAEQGYFKPEFDDSGFDKIRVDTFWNGQGYPELTYGWYRLKFKAPDLPAGKKVYLRFQGIDESAWVHLDGKLVAWYDTADVGRTWNAPVMFDVTGSLKSGQEHLLAVKIHNEDAAGGVWKPVSVLVEK